MVSPAHRFFSHVFTFDLPPDRRSGPAQQLICGRAPVNIRHRADFLVSRRAQLQGFSGLQTRIAVELPVSERPHRSSGKSSLGPS
jgi:hypothetical protein